MNKINDHLDRSTMPLRGFLVLLVLIILSGCGSNIVYRDTFDEQPIGEPPESPDIGTSSVSGDVLIAENPINDVSSDRWLELRRIGAFEFAEYIATPSETLTIDETGSVEFMGYIPSFAPAQMTVLFETLDIEPIFDIAHIDLLSNGDIIVNDSAIEGTYEFDTSISFSINFDLNSTPPTATILVEGGGEDVNTTVELLGENAPSFGLAHVRFVTAFEGETSSSGQFLINQVVIKKDSE